MKLIRFYFLILCLGFLATNYLVFANEAKPVSKAQVDSFLSFVKDNLNNNWQPPDGVTNITAQIFLDNNAAIVNKKFTNKNNSKPALEAVQKAIEATKFPKLDVNDTDKIILTLNFNANMSSHGDGKESLSCKVEIRQLTKVMTKTKK